MLIYAVCMLIIPVTDIAPTQLAPPSGLLNTKLTQCDPRCWCRCHPWQTAAFVSGRYSPSRRRPDGLPWPRLAILGSAPARLRHASPSHRVASSKVPRETATPTLLRDGGALVAAATPARGGRGSASASCLRRRETPRRNKKPASAARARKGAPLLGRRPARRLAERSAGPLLRPDGSAFPRKARKARLWQSKLDKLDKLGKLVKLGKLACGLKHTEGSARPPTGVLAKLWASSGVARSAMLSSGPLLLAG